MSKKKRVKEIANEMVSIGPQIKRKFFSDICDSVNIPHAQMMALFVLNDLGGCCNFSTLRKFLCVSAPTVTGIVDRLEKSKLVKRSYDQNDRRSINVELTSSGSNVIQKIKGVIIKKWEQILGNLTVSESEHLITIFKKILQVEE